MASVRSRPDLTERDSERWRVFARTHVGVVREANEDALAVGDWSCHGQERATHGQEFADDRAFQLVVSDGLGGHRGGAVASAHVVRCMLRNASPVTPERTIAEAARLAREELCRETVENPQLAGLGATVVGVVLNGPAACHYNVGDSRLYLARGGALRQVSIDDRVGRHRVSQAIGGSAWHPDMPLDLHMGRLHMITGDRLLLCSDGLSDVVEAAEIAAALAEMPERASEILLELALRRGGPDNISLIVARRT